MLKCNNCKIDLPGTPKYCPLCQGELSGTGDAAENAYPFIAVEKPHRTLYSWVAFGAITVSVICVAVNLSVPQGGFWSLFVLGGIASLWISFAVIIKKMKNIPKTILWQVALTSLLAFIWDHFTGGLGWSTDYVLPILGTCAMIAMAVVSRVKKLDIKDYIIYLVIDSFWGILSFILILVNYLTVVYPSAICFAASVISLGALISFEGKALWSEIQRRMHF